MTFLSSLFFIYDIILRLAMHEPIIYVYKA